MSPYYDTTEKKFNYYYATLVYYSNVANGEPVSSGGGVAYLSTGQNWLGPITAYTNLPTTSQWKNVTLKNTKRAILGENCDENMKSVDIEETSGGTLPSEFDYTGYAARFLTAREIMYFQNNKWCGLTHANVGSKSFQTKEMMFLTENTDAEKGFLSYWMETPDINTGTTVLITGSIYYPMSTNQKYGVRPVIEVYEGDIEY